MTSSFALSSPAMAAQRQLNELVQQGYVILSQNNNEVTLKAPDGSVSTLGKNPSGFWDTANWIGRNILLPAGFATVAAGGLGLLGPGAAAAGDAGLAAPIAAQGTGVGAGAAGGAGAGGAALVGSDLIPASVTAALPTSSGLAGALAAGAGAGAAAGGLFGSSGANVPAVGSDNIPASVTAPATTDTSLLGLGPVGDIAAGGLAGAGLGAGLSSILNGPVTSGTSVGSIDKPTAPTAAAGGGAAVPAAAAGGGLGSALDTAAKIAAAGGLAATALGSGSNSGSGQSTIDPRLLNLILQNYGRAQGVADRPYQPYAGPLTAGLNPDQQQSGDMFRALPQAGAGLLGSAADRTAGIGADSLLGDISRFQNPYTNDVVNTTLADINRQRQMALAGNASNATLAHAFGGTRQGVTDALTNEAFGRLGAQTAANLRNQGFNTAAGLAQGNQNAMLSSAGLLGNLGQQQFGNAQTAANTILGYGTLGQQTQQSDYDRLLQQYQAGQQYPFQAQGLLNQATGLLPGSGSIQPSVSGSNLAATGSLLSGIGALFGGNNSSGGLFSSLFGR